MERKKIVAGNWKMNLVLEDALQLINHINENYEEGDIELIIFPPTPYLSPISNLLNPLIGLGAQNCHQEDWGAYTGETSMKMIKEFNVKYVLIGHSERRKYYNESNKDTALKVDKAIKNGLIPILCCGETAKERQEDLQLEVVGKQVSEALFHLEGEQLKDVIIAYEPVWAIGTGKTATADQAQEMHSFIRSLVKEKYKAAISHEICIIYGGSCKPNNATELFNMPDIDGGLIGGASLNAEEFLAIAQAF